MKTGIITRSAAVLMIWTGISGLAIGQTLSSKASDANAIAIAASANIENSASLRVSSGSETLDADVKVGQWMETVDAIRTGLAHNDGFIRSDDAMVLALLFH